MSFGNKETGVIYANLGLKGLALSATNFDAAVISDTTPRTYANSLVSAEQAAMTESAFATAILTNLGVTAATIGQAAYDALQPAVAGYLNSVGKANYGVVAVQLAQALSALTADATYGAAAKQLNNAASSAYAYSDNAANTTNKVINVATEAAPVSTFTLTTGTDIQFGTAGNDIFTATDKTLQAGDAIADSNSTDSDALNIAVTSGVSAITTAANGASVVGIENVNVVFKSFAEATVAADNLKGTVTVSQTQAGGSTAATITGVGGNKVVAGSGVTGTFTVTQTAATSLTVDGGAAATVTHTNATTGSVVITGGAATTTASGTATTGSVTISGAALTSATTTGKTSNITLTVAGTTTAGNTTAAVNGTTAVNDVATVSAPGLVTLTNNADVETVNLSGNGAAVTYTAAAAPTATTGKFNLTGNQNITLKMTTAIATGVTVSDESTGTSLVQVTDGGAINVTKIVADAIRLDAITADADITAKTGQVFKVASDTDKADFVSSATAGTTGEVVSIEALGANLVIGNGSGGAGTGTDGFSTFNVSSNTAATALTATIGTAADLVLSGSKAITVATTSTAKSVDASAMTGKFTITLDGTSDIATVIGGSGTQDTIIANTDDQSLAAVSFSGIEVLAIDAADANDNLTVVVKGSQVSGSTLVVSGTEGAAATDDDILSILLDSSSVDASSLVIDTANVDVQFDLTGVAAVAVNITGSSGVDNLTGQGAGKITFNGLAGADSITGGGGADVLTGGEGADTITGAAGNDTIDLTETTSAVDTVVFADTAANNGRDTITGFTVGKDILNFNNFLTTGTETTAAVTNASRTSAAISATDATAYVIDDVSTNLGATTNTTNVITDFTNLNQVAAFLADGFTTTADTAQNAVFVLNSSGTARVYYFVQANTDEGTAIDAAELTLVGIVSTSAAITTTEIAV